MDCNQKRVLRILQTWALLEQRYPDWRLTIVGDGPDRVNLENQVFESQLENVSFEGFQNPRGYYERASILLLTSEFEGFPLVLPECMSFGVVPAVYGSYSAVYDIGNQLEKSLCSSLWRAVIGGVGNDELERNLGIAFRSL